MTITAENVLAHEIIGLGARIVESTDPTLRAVSGTIVFETKNVLSIKVNSEVKQVPKKAAKKIRIETQSGVCFISGSSLTGRPEDRISRY
jgi:ribonuclease P protein subunit POP4